LQRDGRVRCWGDSNLGDGTPDPSSAAKHVIGLSEAKVLASGDGHHCALLRDGTMQCWGFNGSGALGDGTTGYPVVPTKVSDLSSVARIAAGFGSSYAWTTDGALYGWGSTSVPLGIENDLQPAGQLLPARASALGEVAQLALGYVFRCLMRPDASVYCWGYNDEGQLGNGELDALPPSVHTTPERVGGLKDVRLIVAGYAHTCAIVGDGKVLCWGANKHGQLGDGTQTSRATPTPVAGLSDVQQLALGMDHSCALRGDARVVCWGSNESRQLGSNRQGDSLTPVVVPGI
jgi:alpha-tubulin suppressor-like RCC1 family protein